MELKEVGSEFWQYEPRNKVCNALYHNEKWIKEFMVGRAALEFIIRDAIQTKNIKKASLPSYCCHTMIEPFVRNGVIVSFYDVVPEQIGFSYHIDTESDSDAILLMRYFGFETTGYNELVQRAKALNKIVIEDSTHSALMHKPYSILSDYVFISYRKWMATPGGALSIKRQGSFFTAAEQNAREDYIMLRQTAFTEKEAYINSENMPEKAYKDSFLEKFMLAEKMIDEDYVDYGVDEQSKKNIMYADLKSIAKKRRENAHFLISGLLDIKSVALINTKVSEQDAPLFVPILVKDGKREILRQFLTANNIYLPVHWPFSNMHKASNKAKDLYNAELSVVCDQRYNCDDLQHIITMIAQWEKSNE